MFLNIYFGLTWPSHDIGSICVYQFIWAAFSEKVFVCISLYEPRLVKRFQACAKCIDSDSACACAKSHRDICFPLMHSVVSDDSVNRLRRP